ncbi:MAG: S41 family peptidase [Dokdonella sp.]
MFRFICILLLSLCVIPSFATSAVATLTAKQAVGELKLLQRVFTELHPGLYRYITAEQLDAEFARAGAEVANGVDAVQMYRIASRLAAAVRCGHTWTNPLNQSDAMQTSLAALPLLPVHVRLNGDRLLVTASSDSAIRSNDEILDIDGRSSAELVAELLPYLRADGSSDGKRRSQIDSTFDGGATDRLLPLLHPPADGHYQLRLRDPRGVERNAAVAATTIKARESALLAAGVVPESDAWQLRIDGRVATLTLPTFSFWRDDFDWKSFLDRSFDALAARHIERLVIDLRKNEGGDDAIGDALLSHLIVRPHTFPAPRAESAYERVPYRLARYLDTWDFDFFDRTGKVVRGSGRNWVLREQPADRVIVPVARPYRGRVVALVGPRMSSAGYMIARDLKATATATLVGQTTGGNLRGLNGGQLAWITLPYSGVAVDIPLIAWMPKTAQPDHGVDPDIAVVTHLRDVIAGRDVERERALSWLTRHK